MYALCQGYSQSKDSSGASKHLLLPQQLLKPCRKIKDYPFHRLRQVYPKSSSPPLCILVFHWPKWRHCPIPK